MSEHTPKYFHFIFGLQPKRQRLHLIHYLCLESCIRVNNPDKVYLYYHREPCGRYWELIKEKLTLVQVDLASEVLRFRYDDKFIRNNFLYAHHSDFIRVEQINKTGGVYADLDTLFVQALPETLYQKPFVMGMEPPVHCQSSGRLRSSLCNALMIGSANSEFGRHYRNSMAAALDGSWSNHSCFLAHELSQKYPELIHVEPSTSFYKHIWTAEGLNTLLLGCDRDFHGVYSMHLWAHLWWSKRRKDFTSFHAGDMTEEFIRTVDTTYTIVARNFLPPAQKHWFFASVRRQPNRQTNLFRTEKSE